MKKVLVLFLLVVLMYNSIGFIINFQFVLTEWRQEVKHFLLNRSEQKNLTRFVFSKNNFESNTQEFSKDNFRYDVVKTEKLGDSLVVYCFRDEKETQLADNFSEQLFENTSENFLENNFQKKISKNFLEKNKKNNFLKEFFFEKIFFEKNILKNSSQEKNIFCYASLFFPVIFSDVIVAPPEV